MTTAGSTRDARRRYAVYGTGHRAGMYVTAMMGRHADVAVPVAWCDTNETRMRHYDGHVSELGITPGHYWPEDLERMLAEESVDVLLVCSPDHTHAHAVSTALNAGVDVVCEKPLTTDAAGLRQIKEAVEGSSSHLTVTFNYRYSPRNSALRHVIADGTIGRPLSVHFEWLLDTIHGADFFRRWHRDKARSGGLAVHKASHHFDLVNWWLDDAPVVVTALGGLRFYGEQGAGRPEGTRPALGRDAGAGDPYAFDMASDDRLRALYLEAEREDGYVRDRDVFDAGIDIEDTLSVLVGYRSGASLTYSLTAHSPWEGYRVSVNGTRGRAELEVVEREHVVAGEASDLLAWKEDRPAIGSDPGGAAGPGARSNGTRLTVQQHWNVAREVVVDERKGGHGGGDEMLLSDVFRGPTDDALRRPASYVDGLRSVAVGVGVNTSLAEGRSVRLAELGVGLD